MSEHKTTGDWARWRPMAGMFLRFGIVGTFGLVVDMAALAIAVHVGGLNFYWGRVASYLVAATFTWACNRRFTFQERGTSGLLAQWFKFLLVNAAGGLVNFGMYVLVVWKIGPTVLGGWADWLIPYAGVAVGSVSGLFLNFFASHKLVFR